MREAILDKPRREWLGLLWRGMRHPGLRRKSIERRVLGNECVDVGNADQDFGRPVGLGLGHFNLIKVPRRIVVDGRPQQIAEISDPVARDRLRRVSLNL